MKMFESVEAIEAFPNPVLTIGNYDGIHEGHKRIIGMVKEKARELNGTSMLMTFHPHPLTILRPEKHLGLITPLAEKVRLVEETGLDVLIVVPFTAEFASLEPERFIEDILINRIGVKGLIVGFDFKFGRLGRGNTKLLGTYAQKHGFFFKEVEPICINERKVGSNRVRRLILAGDVADANRFLGRPYCIEGAVVEGDRRGSVMGFPTINLATDYHLVPHDGVYITEVKIGEQFFKGVTNIGVRPTFDTSGRTIETHILDFSGDLYGQKVTLCFHEKIREERKFESADGLLEWIRSDIAQARRYFSK